MSQEPNTTSGTNPKPKLRIAGGSEGAPPENSAPAAGALPRFSFSRKKPAPEPAAPTGRTHPPLPHPPPGNHPPAAGEMPAPLTPVKPGATAAPFATKSKPRANTAMLIALSVMLVVALGEAYVIFLMHDQNEVAANNQKPPVVVNPASTEKPIEVVNDGSAPPTAAYKFLLTFAPEIASGNEPRLFNDAKTYHIGDVVAPDYGLKWTRIDDKNRELEFTDKQGRRYIKKF